MNAFMGLHELFTTGSIAIFENIEENASAPFEKKHVSQKKSSSRRNGRKPTIRPSFKDSRNSTLLICTNDENVREEVDKLAERQKFKRLPFHPIMVVVTDQHKNPVYYSVFINHIYMNVPSFKQALSSYLQSFSVFDVHFPREGAKVCKFLYELFFDIKSNDGDIETFISDMELDIISVNNE